MDLVQCGKIRVKTGCKTCRIRRIKCDEGKPDCKRCTSTGRKCDGYDVNWSRARSRSRSPQVSPGRRGTVRYNSSPSHSPPSSSGPQSIKLPVFDDERQRESFSFFVLCTARTQSNLSYSTDFWNRRVLQLSLEEPAIRYALCSLSALHRKFREGSSSSSTSLSDIQKECTTYSLEQYILAVRHTQHLLDLCQKENDGTEKTTDVMIKGIVACVLFICYESLTGNFATSQMHLQNGMRILSRSSLSSSSSDRLHKAPTMIPRDIRRVFSRLDLQAMSFADSAAPYRYASSSTSSESFMRLLDPPGAWEDVDEAMDYLIHNFRWIFHTAARFEPDPVPLLVLAEAEAKSRVWEVRFSSLLDRMHIENVQDQKVKYTITLLRVYQITMGIILGTRIYGHEELHDSYTAEYTRVVTMIESMLPPSSEIRTGIEKGGEEEQIFSFEPGLIFVLFFTAIKCRIPDLRRRAIALLGPPSPSGHSSASSPLLLPHARKARYQEGAWESQAAAAVASFVINIEEENCSSGDDGARTVPLESDRIHVVNVASCILRRQVQVCCVFLTPGQGQGYRVREGVVNY